MFAMVSYFMGMADMSHAHRVPYGLVAVLVAATTVVCVYGDIL